MPSAPPPRQPAGPPIICFDGVCGLCNRFVDVLLRLDRRHVLRFAPLQGSTARARLPAGVTTGVDTVVLLDDAGVHQRSDAVLRILGHLGQPWRGLAWLGWAVPRPVRDCLYDAIAARRYGWFGQRKTCRLPTVEERNRFLD
ncbi:MAG TPA: DCC1-like thiol-disulfide oxidoreductase family protein [bacterium]